MTFNQSHYSPLPYNIYSFLQANSSYQPQPQLHHRSGCNFAQLFCVLLPLPTALPRCTQRLLCCECTICHLPNMTVTPYGVTIWLILCSKAEMVDIIFIMAIFTCQLLLSVIFLKFHICMHVRVHLQTTCMHWQPCTFFFLWYSSQFRPWLTSIGFSLCFGTINAKMYRVYYIFHNPTVSTRKRVSYTNYSLQLVVSLRTDY